MLKIMIDMLYIIMMIFLIWSFYLNLQDYTQKNIERKENKITAEDYTMFLIKTSTSIVIRLVILYIFLGRFFKL